MAALALPFGQLRAGIQRGGLYIERLVSAELSGDRAGNCAVVLINDQTGTLRFRVAFCPPNR